VVGEGCYHSAALAHAMCLSSRIVVLGTDFARQVRRANTLSAFRKISSLVCAKGRGTLANDVK